MSAEPPATGNNRPVYTVSALSREVRLLLETSYAGILVEGEISGLSAPASGHQYFTLKDENAQLRCAFFRNRARLSPTRLSNGQHIIATVNISLYETRGDFQLIVQSVVDAGEGLLRQRFEALKLKLAAEGLFASSSKRPVPSVPRRAGIITSATGAAIHDIITTFRRRYAAIPLLIYPTSVQGDKAAAEIARQIKRADERQDCDVLVLARGGGSLEDLWPFNEEIVARAIVDCSIPVVSAVGHESDFSIADMVADVRAATPTAAAELLSPDSIALENALTSLKRRLFNVMDTSLLMAAQKTDHLLGRLPSPQEVITQAEQNFSFLNRQLLSLMQYSLANRQHQLLQTSLQLRGPGQRLKLASQHTEQLVNQLHQHSRSFVQRQVFDYQLQHERLQRFAPRSRIQSLWTVTAGHEANLLQQMPRIIREQQQQLQKNVHRLHALSPLQTLARGFASLQNSTTKKPICSIRDVSTEDCIKAMLQDGEIICRVEKTSWTNPYDTPDETR